MLKRLSFVFISFSLFLSFNAFAAIPDDISDVDNLQGHEYVIPGSRVHYVESSIVGENYELRVALPGAYFSNPNADFSVAYVLDGQWDYTVAADINGKLGYDGMVPGLIVVAITWAGDNVNYDTKRQRDFLHSVNPYIPESGGAANFLDALEQEIIPFVEMVYRTNDHRTLMGSSFGGLFTTYAMLAKPKLFTGYIALAAPYGVEQQYFSNRIAELSGTRELSGVRSYLAVGSYDFNQEQVLSMAQQLREARIKGLKVKRKVFSRLGHAGATPVGYSYGLQYVFKRPKLRLDSAIVQQYIGTYAIAPEYPTITIAYDGKNLLFTQQGQETLEFYAESETTFYYPGVNYQLEFIAGEDPAMTMLVKAQGSTYPFVRQDSQ